MLSDLSLIDWAALIIAVTLLIVTAVAAYLSRGGSRAVANPAELIPAEYQRFPSRPPAHAASDREPSFKAPPPPVIRRSQPPLIHKRSTPPVSDPVPADSSASFAPKIIDLTDGAQETVAAPKPKPVPEQRTETVAERAARLRRAKGTSHSQTPRPVSESRKIHRSTPAEAAQPLTFAGAGNKLSVGMETTAGFSVRKPGFFEDPIGRHEQRYWDGSGWTEHCKEGEQRFSDPL